MTNFAPQPETMSLPEAPSVNRRLFALPHLREAAAPDIAAVQAIYAHHVRHGLASFEEEAPDHDEMLHRFEAVRAAGLPYIVACDEPGSEGGVFGYAYATAYRPRSAYRFTVENSVYVAPGLAGRGIGTALLAELIRRCETGSWRQMIAVIGNGLGNAASVALHHRCGFRLVGNLEGVGLKHGAWRDTLLMQRCLGPGRDTLP